MLFHSLALFFLGISSAEKCTIPQIPPMRSLFTEELAQPPLETMNETPPKPLRYLHTQYAEEKKPYLLAILPKDYFEEEGSMNPLLSFLEDPYIGSSWLHWNGTHLFGEAGQSSPRTTLLTLVAENHQGATLMPFCIKVKKEPSLRRKNLLTWVEIGSALLFLLTCRLTIYAGMKKISLLQEQKREDNEKEALYITLLSEGGKVGDPDYILLSSKKIFPSNQSITANHYMITRKRKKKKWRAC